jgi:hypothetical protein
MKIGAGKTFGSFETSSQRASMPLSDAPMTKIRPVMQKIYEKAAVPSLR